MTLTRGMDVARFQGEINWGQVPAAREFAYLGMLDWRVVDTDPQLARNVHEASESGRTIGGYMRVDPTRWPAVREVQRMAGLLSAHDLMDPSRLWPAVDIEPTGAPGDRIVNWPAWTRDFITGWKTIVGLPLVVYSSGSYFASLLGGTADWPEWVRIWVGHSERYSRPKGLPAEEWAGRTWYETQRAVVHQYTTTGQLPGITTQSGSPLVDLDCLMPGVALADITLKAA